MSIHQQLQNKTNSKLIRASAATQLITETLTSCSARNSVSSGEMIDVLLDLQKHLNDLHRTALAAVKGWMAAVESNTYAGVDNTNDNDVSMNV